MGATAADLDGEKGGDRCGAATARKTDGGQEATGGRPEGVAGSLDGATGRTADGAGGGDAWPGG